MSTSHPNLILDSHADTVKKICESAGTALRDVTVADSGSSFSGPTINVTVSTRRAARKLRRTVPHQTGGANIEVAVGDVSATRRLPTVDSSTAVDFAWDPYES